MKTILYIAFGCLVLGVESQFFAQSFSQNNDDIGRIYFEDNVPHYVNNIGFNPNLLKLTTPVPTIYYDTRGTYEPDVDIQASVQTNSQLESKVPVQDEASVGSQRQSHASGSSAVNQGIVPLQSSSHSGPASTEFGINVFKEIAKEQPGNIAVSPFSISILLALLQQGATGNTLDQINKALQMTPEKSAEVYKQMTEEIQKRSSRNILKSANNVFLSDSFNLNTQFKRIAINNFGSDVTPMSFGNPASAADNINSWVASKTNNKIDKLINPDALSANTQMVMVNAVYFKGLWEIPFREQSTVNRPFTLKSGEKITAPFMQTRRYFKAGMNAAKTKVIILPFEFNEYSLIVVLPHEASNIDAAISTLTIADLASFFDLPPKDVALELPRFNIRADTDLKPVLRKMGVSNIFDRQAELSNLGTYGSFSPQVSSALHTAVLTIDEKGGSAAAATSFAAVALSYDEPSLFFRANKPFIAILWDNRSHIPLFMARVMDPTVQ